MVFAATLIGSLMVLGALATQFQAVQEARTGKALAIAQMARDEGFLLHHWLHEYRASEGSTQSPLGVFDAPQERQRPGLDPLDLGDARLLTAGERQSSETGLDVDEQGFDRYAEIRMPMRREIGGWGVEHALLAPGVGSATPCAPVCGIVVVQPPGTAATATGHDQAIRDEVARELRDSLFAPESDEWVHARQAIPSLEAEWDFAFWAWRFAGIDEGNLLRDPRSGFPNWNQIDGDLTVRGDMSAILGDVGSVVARQLHFNRRPGRPYAQVEVENVAADGDLYVKNVNFTDRTTPRPRIVAREMQVDTAFAEVARIDAPHVQGQVVRSQLLEDVDILVVDPRYGRRSR